MYKVGHKIRQSRLFPWSRRAAAAFLLILFSLLSPAGAAPDAAAPPAKPLHISGKVVTPDGKPAPDATVTLDLVDSETDRLIVTQTAKPDADGLFDITADGNKQSGHGGNLDPILYVTSPAGVAFCPNVDKAQTITLQPVTTVRVHLLDQDGKPLAHVPLTPDYFVLDRNFDRNFMHWDKAVVGPWNCETDAAGTAVFAGLPQGYAMSLSVGDEHFAPPDWKSQIKLATQAVTPDQSIHLVRGGTITGTVLYGPTQKPAAGIRVEATENGEGSGQGLGVTDQDGRYQITRLPGGAYTLMTYLLPDAEWTSVARTAALGSGAQVSGMDFSLVHGALLAGTVTDKQTGKPVAGVYVSVNGPGHPSGTRGGISTESGPDGRFQMRIPAGSQSVMAYSPGTNEGDSVQQVKVAEGETKTLVFKVTPPLLPKPVHGVVLGLEGKPVPSAEVLATDVQQQEQKVVTDDQGRFAFDAPGLTTKARLFARLGDLGTRTGSAVTGDSADVTLHLVAGAFCTINGMVKGADGKPIRNAKIALIRWHDGSGSDVDSTQTDAQGRYSFRPAYANVEYCVRAEAVGYAQKYSENKQAAGTALTFLPLVVIRADSFVAGTVVDPQGKPVAGATVRDDDLPDRHAVTDKSGRFRINGVARGKSGVGVQAPEERYASIEVASGRVDNIIKVRSQAEVEEQSRRFGAMMKADTTNHGNGAYAQVLLKTAEARAASGGKKVLLVFHASWCGPCFLLHRFLEDPRVKPIIDAHFVVQDLDIWEHKKNPWENPGGIGIYKKYGGPNSVPFFVVLDPTGKKLGNSIHNGDNMGMPSEPDDIRFFLNLLKTAAPRLTAREIATLNAGIRRGNVW